jgi:hypothetical protein
MQVTPVQNLALAGAHTRTDIDVWSIEAAVESGWRAAQLFEPTVRVLCQYPLVLLMLRALDNALCRFYAPNVLDVALMLLSSATIATIIWRALRQS